MAGAASEWTAAAGGDVLSIRGNPSGFVDSYAGSVKATVHMGYGNVALLPLACGGLPPGRPGGSIRGGGGGGPSSSGSTGGSGGGTGGVCAGLASARGLLRRATGGWSSGGAGPAQSAEDVAAALAAARAAAEKAVDMALGSSSPVLQLCVQSGTTAAAVAAAAAAAAALAALTRPGGNSSSNSSGGGDGSSGGGGGGSRAHTPGPACAFLSSTANCKHAAVRQLLLQWRPAEWRAPLPRMGATALPHAAMLGAWPVVSELLRAGVDPRDAGAPATVLYLALVQGRGAMAAWLLVRLLACPFGVWNEVVGAVFAAFVTLMMGLASPLQLLPHHHNKPLMYLEKVLRHIGFAMVYILAVRELPAMFLHKDIADLVVVAAWLPVGC